MKFCPKCGTRVEEGTVCCPNCGFNTEKKSDVQNDGTVSNGSYANANSTDSVFNELLTDYKDLWMNNYVKRDGRVSLRKYWMTVLANGIVILVLCILARKIHGLSFLSMLYNVAVYILLSILFIRRMHDVGKSGLYLLLYFIPIVGWILVLIQAVKKGQPASNQYGDVPPEK